MTVTMMLMRPCAAVIFDMDGVLLDTEPLYTRATNRVLAPFGAQLSWTLKAQIMGRDPWYGAELVLSALGVPLDPGVYLQQVDSELRELLHKAKPMPRVRAWLTTLRSTGVRTAVATSSSRERFELKSKGHPWLRAMTPIVCGDDSCVKQRKPAPDIFLAAAAQLNVAPERCLVFEDSPSGVAAAKAAGMRVVGLLAPGLDAAALGGADLLIRGYDDISADMFIFERTGDAD